MITPLDTCSNCWEPITNPICIECHLRQINLWMRENNIHPKKREYILKRIKRKIPKIKNIENAKCILCNTNRLTVCSYCLFLISARIIVEENFNAALIEDFLQVFNYQLGNEEYPIDINIY